MAEHTATRPFHAAVSRRLVLKGGAAVAASLSAPSLALAQDAEGSTILSIADLHSAYARLPQLLTVIRKEAAESNGPVTIVLNGDLFELNNVVAVRSRGEADLAFLKALAETAPTILNIGNHEPDFVDDMADIVAMVEAMGVTVISNIVDPRTDRLYAPLATDIEMAGRSASALAIATDNLFTYPEAIRPQLAIPAPVPYAQALVGKLATQPVLLLTHAGLQADKQILPLLPKGSVAIGGHNHLTLSQHGDVTYAHGGAWGRLLLRLVVTSEGDELSATVTALDVPLDGEGDAPLAALIGELEATHLTEEDRAVVADLPAPLPLTEGIFGAVEAVRQATGADVAFVGHTTFGTGLPAGPVRQYDFDAFVRFDGDIRTAEVSGATLAEILERANQHDAATLEERSGDFVYARAFEIDPAARYTIAANGWTAINQGSYLGTSDLEFAEFPDLRLKQVVADALPQ